MARIAVIARDPMVRTFLHLLLQKDGHRSSCAGSEDGVLHLLRTCAADVVILEMDPDDDEGTSLTVMKLKLFCPGTRLLGLIPARFARRPDLEAIVRSRGADGCLLMPFTVGGVRAAVDRQIRAAHISCSIAT